MPQSFRLQDKVAIVTGSSSGLGRAIAIRYVQEGAKLVCADLTPTARSQEEAEITTHDLIVRDGGQAIFVRTDVGDATQMENLVQVAVKEYGRLDMYESLMIKILNNQSDNFLGLVNNAGISIEARTPAVLHLTDETTWDTTMRVNTKSVFLGCKYALTQMLAQEPHSSGDRGWIINISSIMGMIGGLENPSYCASKGAVSNLTRQMALDYAPDNIHINAICPGYTQTAIFKETTTNLTPWEDLKRRHPLKGPGMPEDIARTAVVLASDDASWVTGVCLPVDGGYTAR
ncbi:Glucose/ribitol dehydrogenase [Penicillium expansum]|uniref:Glucose/ribitol dehydrogenase n=1 Tax=Penicillium expansum TaxID=27334 RepID=A0A0A2J2B3_PENEN|nr:Glucose/ribitol dehydrogenase [Penicillium expansum]KGO49497.1 Glucose/ribitol dehydrogenase [Penicillium expansum]